MWLACSTGCKKRKTVGADEADKDNEEEETSAVPTTMRPMEEEKRKAMSRRMMRKRRKRKEKLGDLDLEEIFKFSST